MARRNLVLDSSDESGNDSDNAAAQEVNGLVDVEAEESSDESDSDSDDSSSDTADGLLDLEAEDSKSAAFSPIDPSPLESFPQFARLPPELRERVWEFFCPELGSKHGRVMRFMADYIPQHDPAKPAQWVLTDRNATLDQQTELFRIVGAVHHESRESVVKRFPDTLPIYAGSGDAEVRFNGRRDIIAIEFDHTNPVIRQGPSTRRSAGHVYGNIGHVAFSLVHHYVSENRAVIDGDFCTGMADMLTNFPKAQTAYVWVENWELPISTRWAAAPFACHYLAQTYEQEPGLGEDAEWIFCWPDTVNHPDFSKYNVIEPFRREVGEESLESLDAIDVKFAPLVSFDLSSGVKEFYRLVDDYESGIPIDQDDDRPVSEDESGDESLDEYESEGIDDSEIIEEDGEESEEEEIIPRPRRVQMIGAPLEESRDAEPAVEDGLVGGVTSRGRKRRIVSDSDDDSDGGEPTPKRARTGNAAPTVSNDDSNESSNESKSQSGSSDDDNDGDDDDDDDNDDDVPPARLSLAERLRQFRDENPIPSDDENSSGEISDEEDEDDDEDDDDDDGRGGGFIDDMAEDSEDEGDESDGSEEE